MSNENNPVSEGDDSRDIVIANHRYDGIREYDNPMPGWWKALFWGTIVFSIIYAVGFFFMGFVDHYDDDLNQSLEKLAAVRAEYEAANPTMAIDEETLSSLVGQPERIEAGKTLFTAQCAACHGPQGQGLIGPNMTDDYWIHGGSNMDMFSIISKGVTEKGMPPWEAVYSPEERADLVAFIRSLRGTNPEGAKEPQGELYEEN